MEEAGSAENQRNGRKNPEGFLCVLVQDYHFGRKRGREFYERCGKMLSEADDNPVFWEQRDRICIDYLGIEEFGRDYTYHGKAVREDDWA